MSKWFKCDLQVGTPGWRFSVPAGIDVDTGAGRTTFAEMYIAAAKNKGVHVLGLASHNNVEWTEEFVQSGKRHGVTVLPGVEVTTGTGSDGVHLIILADPRTTRLELERLLSGELGFDTANPTFIRQGNELKPAPSGKTIEQILDRLPVDFVAIAPHALSDNGIASGDTVEGTLRWRALHHHRLSAIDVGATGAGDAPDKERFNKSFRERQLKYFPCLKTLAFIETSDAYCLEDIGRRFCWIRMEEPSVEGLRHAFLDHEARIICGSDPRLNQFPDNDPNNVRHGWIESIDIGGTLGNSDSPLGVAFLPGLNVVIGGRGSGKSTVVAAIRRLYSGMDTLPEKIRVEAETFSNTVFGRATISAKHRLAGSQVQQEVRWEAGSANMPDQSTPGSSGFAVRVVNQKELFERVSQDRNDQLAASRSFIAFVDESLGLNRTYPLVAGTWSWHFEQARLEWVDASVRHHSAKIELAQLPQIQARIKQLEDQLKSFDNDITRVVREAAKKRESQHERLHVRLTALSAWLEKLRLAAIDEGPLKIMVDNSAEDAEYLKLEEALDRIIGEAQTSFNAWLNEQQKVLSAWKTGLNHTDWWTSYTEAQQALENCLKEMLSKGIDPDSYGQLQKDLIEQRNSLDRLADAKQREESSLAKVEAASGELNARLDERRQKRALLLSNVEEKSKRLKFVSVPHNDRTGWIKNVREVLNLRPDWFSEDLTRLSEWLSEGSEDLRLERYERWKQALLSLDFSSLTELQFRKDWLKKLQSIELSLRIRLASEFLDDSIEIYFLKDDGKPSVETDWQSITEGSPGQRTAAMLAFVLHHGSEPLILDQPEDDLDTELISHLVVKELRASRWRRQLIVVTHNANIPVNGDADRVIVLENKRGVLRIRRSNGSGSDSLHVGPIENTNVRCDIQKIMEGGIDAFVQRERKYNNELQSLVKYARVQRTLSGTDGSFAPVESTITVQRINKKAGSGSNSTLEQLSLFETPER